MKKLVKECEPIDWEEIGMENVLHTSVDALTFNQFYEKVLAHVKMEKPYLRNEGMDITSFSLKVNLLQSIVTHQILVEIERYETDEEYMRRKMQEEAEDAERKEKRDKLIAEMESIRKKLYELDDDPGAEE